MTRIALGVEYDGSAFHGWQIQPGRRTVQGTLQEALGRVAASPVASVCAGRTDAGVHATGQVVHVDVDVVRPPHAWVIGTNSYLPPDASVAWACEVPIGFHARFSALSRSYSYLIMNRAARSSLNRLRSAWVRRALDIERMQAAARCLVGTHDFSAFRAAQCQAKTAERTVHRLEVQSRGELVAIHVTANAFLHHMVRNIAGTLIKIGKGEETVEWAAAVLAGRERAAAGPTAPPEGLYLVAVGYPSEHDLSPGFTVGPLGLAGSGAQAPAGGG